jgi:acetyl esterase/lipase
LKSILVFLVLSLSFYDSAAQEKQIPLYDKAIPNSKKAPAGYAEYTDSSGLTYQVTTPTLIPYFPEKGKATGTAVIICPPGGYLVLPLATKSAELAKAFAQRGITAFVLKYRLPSDAIMIDKTIGSFQDAQRAIQLVRKRAAEWGIDPHKVGLAGLSAGGHVASTAGTHFNKAVIENKEGINLRPDFMLLVYPVIMLNPAIPSAPRERLMGKMATKKMLDFYSNEKQVTAQTPPSYLIHAVDDDVVPLNNSLLFFNALVKAKVKTGMHIYQSGEHGFGLVNPTSKDSWFSMCVNWMEENGF